MVVECVLSCPPERNAREAVVLHHPGVDALGMTIGGAPLQAGAGMYFWLFRDVFHCFIYRLTYAFLRYRKNECYACHTLQVFCNHTKN